MLWKYTLKILQKNTSTDDDNKLCAMSWWFFSVWFTTKLRDLTRCNAFTLLLLRRKLWLAMCALIYICYIRHLFFCFFLFPLSPASSSSCAFVFSLDFSSLFVFGVEEIAKIMSKNVQQLRPQTLY